MTQDDDVVAEAELVEERLQPGGVARHAVLPVGERLRLAEPRQVGCDDADAAEEGDDRLQTVVVAPETVDRHESDRGIVRPVDPVPRRAAEHLDFGRTDGDRPELLGVRGRHGGLRGGRVRRRHPASLGTQDRTSTNL
ncbi:hypothetical protein GCM10025867_28170 [Frondihabitans sucicola]|uniref:DUF2382 domain-containing protein n=1 Tax=Frondihabitans sucicola TaxID=1268041 RepID=A0ABM8GQJ9_9MICO|nr:hypothetical protein GCM10025867_28170 [Frondihabitans sucicola]